MQKQVACAGKLDKPNSTKTKRNALLRRNASKKLFAFSK